jgi:chromosome segregation ATPase
METEESELLTVNEYKPFMEARERLSALREKTVELEKQIAELTQREAEAEKKIRDMKDLILLGRATDQDLKAANKVYDETRRALLLAREDLKETIAERQSVQEECNRLSQEASAIVTRNLEAGYREAAENLFKTLFRVQQEIQAANAEVKRGWERIVRQLGNGHAEECYQVNVAAGKSIYAIPDFVWLQLQRLIGQFCNPDATNYLRMEMRKKGFKV